MKNILFYVWFLMALPALAQRNTNAALAESSYSRLFEAKYMQKPPQYPFGADSCKRFYFASFGGFDSVLSKVIERGDTAKYIRVYFSFIVDKNGAPYEGRFERMASTQYARGESAKTIRYFSDDRKYYDKQIADMIGKMPFWKPGLQNGVPVDSRVEDFLQFWVGINP
ncbi:MAG: hypothetical protein EPO58_12620, partial [Chitinophagaceae bacterium]